VASAIITALGAITAHSAARGGEVVKM